MNIGRSRQESVSFYSDCCQVSSKICRDVYRRRWGSGFPTNREGLFRGRCKSGLL